MVILLDLSIPNVQLTEGDQNRQGVYTPFTNACPAMAMNQQCPFVKNRGAGDWYTIIMKPGANGLVSSPSTNQSTHGNLGHLCYEYL